MNINYSYFPCHYYDINLSSAMAAPAANTVQSTLFFNEFPLPIGKVAPFEAVRQQNPLQNQQHNLQISPAQKLPLSAAKIDILLNYKLEIYLDIKRQLQMIPPISRSLKGLCAHLQQNLCRWEIDTLASVIFLKAVCSQQGPCDLTQLLKEGKLAKVFKKGCGIQKSESIKKFPVPLGHVIAALVREETAKRHKSIVNIFYNLKNAFNLKSEDYFIFKNLLKDKLRYAKSLCTNKTSWLLNHRLLSSTFIEGLRNEQAIEIGLRGVLPIAPLPPRSLEEEDRFIALMSQEGRQILLAAEKWIAPLQKKEGSGPN